MTVIIEKEEYDIMLLASRYKEAFSVPEMQQMQRSAGITGKAETYAIAYLNRLAEKKLVKKRFRKTGFFKKIPVYQSCCSEASFLQNTRKLDTSLEPDRTLAMEKRQKEEKERLRILRSPFVIAEGTCLSAQERAHIQKMIDTLE